MRTARSAAWATMLLSASVVLCLATFSSRAQDAAKPKPEAGVVPKEEPIDAALKKRRDRVRELEETIEAILKEFDAQNEDARFESQLAVMKAQGDHQHARMTRTVAEIAVVEYENGIFPRDLEGMKAEIKLAGDAIQRAKERYEASKAAYERARETSDLAKRQAETSKSVGDRLAAAKAEQEAETAYARSMSDTLAQQKAEFELELAETRLKVLNEYDRPRRLKELQSEVLKAKSEELAKEAILQLQRAKLGTRQRLMKRYRVNTPDELVISLMDDAVERERRVAKLVAEAKELADQIAAEPKDAKALTEKMEAKRAEAKKLAGEAQGRMFEGTAIAKSVAARWARVRDLQKELRVARNSLEVLEKVAEQLARKR